ncbi:hypothetical protein MTO96_013862 [Rhipicephalus appendiculatus]
MDALGAGPLLPRGQGPNAREECALRELGEANNARTWRAVSRQRKANSEEAEGKTRVSRASSSSLHYGAGAQPPRRQTRLAWRGTFKEGRVCTTLAGGKH